MGTPYASTPHGTPPVCTSLEWLRWRDDHIDFRLAECPIARGTTRYVDFTLGNDSNNGTIGSPWKTVARVNDAVDAASTDAELSILFKRGETWSMNGLTGIDVVGKNNVTLGAYGTGWKPNLTWFVALSSAGWTLTSGKTITYERTETNSVAWVREQLSFDAVLVKRTSIDAVEDNPGSWYWDGSKLYLSARSAKSPYTHILPSTSGIAYQVVYNNTGYGIAATGDNIRIDNLRVDGSGCVTTAQNIGGYGIWWAPVNPTDCCVVSDSEAYYNQAHNIGTTTVGSGGIFTVVNCRAGWMSGTATASGATSGTVYVSYAGLGGQEALWVGNCNAAGNLPAAAVSYTTLNAAGGILMHCNGANTFELGLAYGNYNDTPEYQVQGIAGFAGAPTWSDLANCRSWIMDSKFRCRDANAADAASGGVTTVGTGLIGNDGVAINNYTEVRCLSDNAPSGFGRYIAGFGISNQVLINNIIDLDWLDNVPHNTQPRALWYGSTETNVEVYNSTIVTRVRGRAWASIGFISGSAIKLFNCHLVSYSFLMRLLTSNNADRIKNNEYSNFWPGFKTDGTSGWSNDATGTEELTTVTANRVNTGSSLLSANQFAVKGYYLEYDYYEQPRIVDATARGPIEIIGSDALRYGEVEPSSGLFIYNTVSRNVTDETPILFTWPSASATITVTRSIDAGSYGAATGLATFAYTQDGQHFYSLAYSANDRPVGAGSVVYRLNDGAVVRLLPLQVEVGGGGGAAVNVLPLSGIVESRIDGTTISVFTSETPTVSITVVDGEGNAVTVTSLTLSLVIERRATADLVVIADASITKSGSTISFAVPSQATSAEGHHRWSLRDTADDSVLLQGPFIVTYAPTVDT